MNLQEMLSRLTNIDARAPKLRAGKHVFIIDSFCEDATRDGKAVIDLRLYVLESDTHTKGTIVENRFWVGGQNPESAWRKVFPFITALTGETDIGKIKAAIYALASKGSGNPARGIAVKCIAEEKVYKAGTGLLCDWSRVEDQDLEAQRALLDGTASAPAIPAPSPALPASIAALIKK